MHDQMGGITASVVHNEHQEVENRHYNGGCKHPGSGLTHAQPKQRQQCDARKNIADTLHLAIGRISYCFKGNSIIYGTGLGIDYEADADKYDTQC